MTTRSAHTSPDARTPRRWLIAVALCTVAALTLALPRLLFDTNFQTLWEATGLLAGEHPYRDFLEWGVPLQAALSAVMQWVVGYRMFGEFVLIHWVLITAGAVISFDLAYRLSRSLTAAALTAAVALAVLPDTPTYHYPKLILYPAAIWLAWRYLDRPGVISAAALGLLTAVAFLFRHDHGVYVGIAAVLACVLARWTEPGRAWRRTFADTAAYAAVATVVLLPWFVTVQRYEGLSNYLRSRSELYGVWSGGGAYALLVTNPLRLGDSWKPPAPRAGVVRFSWQPPVTDAQRADLEQRYGLRAIEGPGENDRWRYNVENLYEPKLWELSHLISDPEGFDWNRLRELNSWLPPLEPARTLLAQIILIVPLLLLGSVGFEFVRAWRLGTRVPNATYALAVAAVFLTVVDARLFREASYAFLVAPLTAAVATRFFTARGVERSTADWARLATASAVVAVAGYAAVACLQPADLFQRSTLEDIPRTFGRLLVSPPIDAFATTQEVADWTNGRTRDDWNARTVSNWSDIVLRYMHDCAAVGDHVFVAGSTPYHINYLVERPAAGGQVFWHHGWLSGPRYEPELVALLQRQSVPFAFSTHDPVMDVLKAYPSVHAHFAERYTPLPGTEGRLLVDTRRTPTGYFGPFEFPCFR